MIYLTVFLCGVMTMATIDTFIEALYERTSWWHVAFNALLTAMLASSFLRQLP